MLKPLKLMSIVCSVFLSSQSFADSFTGGGGGGGCKVENVMVQCQTEQGRISFSYSSCAQRGGILKFDGITLRDVRFNFKYNWEERGGALFFTDVVNGRGGAVFAEIISIPDSEKIRKVFPKTPKGQFAYIEYQGKTYSGVGCIPRVR